MLKNLTIKRKITALQLSAQILMILVLGFSVNQLVNLTTYSKENILTASETASVLSHLNNMNIAVIREAKASKDVWMRGSDSDEKEKARAEFTDQMDNFISSSESADEHLAKLIVQDASLAKFKESLGNVVIEHKKVSEKLLAQIDAHTNMSDSDGKVGGIEKKLFRQVQLLRNEFLDSFEKRGQADLMALDQQHKNQLMIAIGAAVASMVLFSFLSYFISRSIVRPLADLHSTMTQVEKNGDFTLRVAVSSDDEVGEAAQSFNRLMESLQSSFRELLEGLNQVTEASKLLSSTASKVATSATAQSEAAANMAATVEQVTVSIGEVSGSAGEASKISRKSGELSLTGGDIIHNASAEMMKIAKIVKQTSADIENLGRQSSEISSIVQVIKDVADQTNLLALNAAIEAARAGEQGRGFAVVADEVRKLAERTTKATQEIGEMIGKIQDSSRLSVSSMSSAVTQATGGVELAQQAGLAINQIKEGANEVIRMVNDISLALGEQSTASNDIAIHVERVAQMSESNRAAAGESANAASHLQLLAGNMQKVVVKFKV